MSDEEQKQAPEHHASQARCVNMPNDEPEGHYWSWVNAPQSVPNQYRECMSCGRIDATEWLSSRDQQIALAAYEQCDELLRNMMKEYSNMPLAKRPNAFNYLYEATKRLSALKAQENQNV